MVLDKWNSISSMNTVRSQAAACRINDNEIIVLGGYNKEKGTLDSIEKYNIAKNQWETLHTKIPIPLRRFMVVRVAKNLVLIMGGLTKFSKES